jgi:hypothetical protein
MGHGTLRMVTLSIKVLIVTLRITVQSIKTLCIELSCGIMLTVIYADTHNQAHYIEYPQGILYGTN